MLDLQTLQIYVDLIDAKSFSRAAEKNFVTQSAVSQRIKNLEQQLGQPLLDRGQGRRSASSTDAGAALAAGARRLLRDASVLETEIRELTSDGRGTVSVVTVYSVGLHALAPVLKPFLYKNPKIHVDVQYKQTEQVYRDVGNGTFDVGIVACPAAKRGYRIIPFSREPMICICAPEHPLSDSTEISLTQLEGLNFIGFDDDVPTRRLIEEQFNRYGVRVRLIATFDNIETIKSLVEIGNGVSVVPLDTVKQEVREGTLIAIPFKAEHAFERDAGLIVKVQPALRASVLAFIDALALKN